MSALNVKPTVLASLTTLSSLNAKGQHTLKKVKQSYVRIQTSEFSFYCLRRLYTYTAGAKKQLAASSPCVTEAEHEHDRL